MSRNRSGNHQRSASGAGRLERFGRRCRRPDRLRTAAFWRTRHACPQRGLAALFAHRAVCHSGCSRRGIAPAASTRFFCWQSGAGHSAPARSGLGATHAIAIRSRCHYRRLLDRAQLARNTGTGQAPDSPGSGLGFWHGHAPHHLHVPALAGAAPRCAQRARAGLRLRLGHSGHRRGAV